MPNVQSPMGGLEELETASGATLRVETENALTVIVEGGGHASQRVTLPYPDAGYGGHELLLSADETYLVLFLYSGQCEQGYELFTYRPEFAHIASFPYVVGVGDAPVFSRDGRLLAMAWTLTPGRVQKLASDVTESAAVPWVEVHLRRLDDGTVWSCLVQVRSVDGARFDAREHDVPEGLRVTATEVAFDTDWGVQVRIPLPLPEVVVVEGPTPL